MRQEVSREEQGGCRLEGGERMEEKTLKAATETALRKQVELLAQDGMCGGALEDAISKIHILVHVLHELKN